MAGNSRQKKTSGFSFFKSRRPQEVEDYARDDPVRVRKVWPSDEDGDQWVADPKIDRKASIFIEEFHRSRFMELERQTLAICRAANA